MALRMVELVVPRDAGDDLTDIADLNVLGFWKEPLDGEMVLLRVLVFSDDAESVIDTLESRLDGKEGARIFVFEVQATLPQPVRKKKDEEASDHGGDSQNGQEAAEKKPQRIACAELVERLSDQAKVNQVYILTVVLSAVVAAVGLLRDDTVVVIGAMVIAPLLTPNMTLALATTLGDVRLARRSMVVNLAGLSTSLVVAVALGLVFGVDPTVGEIAARTRVSLGDVALGLASGSAGALAVTTGLSGALVGVMVAVALLPPLVTAGLLLGNGDWELAGRAALLLATNLICVNLAAVATFLWQGVRPNRWWEEKRAKRMVVYAAMVWAGLLAILIGLILYAGKR